MSLIKSNGGGLGGSGSPGGALGTFYSHSIGQSLRMNTADSAYLSRTSVSGGSTNTMTYSSWVKRVEPGVYHLLWYGKGTNYDAIWIGEDNQIQVIFNSTSSGYPKWTFKLRDPSAWFNIVVKIKLDESTDTDRVKLYINGVDQGDASNYPSSSATFAGWLGNTNVSYMGFDSGSTYGGGMVADVNVLDGVAAGPDSFGETKDGVWVPKNTSGLTFGANGFRLEFANTGTATTSEGTTATTNIGDDSSGQGHNFAVSGITQYDVLKDSPTNNFPIMNRLVTVGKGQSVFGAFTEGNLKVRNTASNYSQAIATHGVQTGKYYYECYINEAGYPSWMIGWMVAGMNGLRNVEFPTNAGAADAEQASFTGFGYFTSSNLYISDWGDTSNGIATQQFAHSGAHSAGDAPTTGDIIGVAADFDNRKLYWHINGEYINSGSGTSNPSTGANANSTYTASEAPDANHKFPWLMGYGTSSFVFNFGQDDSFAGNKTSGSAAASDGDGNGEFYYAVPTGFKALCTSNFPDVTIGPGQSTLASDVFGTVLYSGNSGTNAITGLGFQPDWVWVKSRTNTYNHESYDSVRGVNKRIYPDSPNAEDTGSLSAFGSDGFTHTSGSIGGNASGQTYVGWCWKAGTSFSNDASSTSVGNVDSAGSVNQAAGFGIIGYTGVGQSEMDIAHGLGTTPELIWLKDRDTNSNNNQFHGWHKDISTDYIYLSGSGASATEGDGYGTFKSAHTDALVKFRTNGSANTMTESGDKYIMYLFFSVEGYSMVGTHKGNGADDGTYVYTGFRPAYVIIKNVDSSGSWIIFDSTREGGVHNIVNDHLMADTTADEGTDNDIDFLSNGFKCRRASASFNTAHQFIFLAIADLPFKFANAR